MSGLDISGLFGAGGISDENAAAFLPALAARQAGYVIGELSGDGRELAYVWMLPLGPIAQQPSLCPYELGAVVDAVEQGHAVAVYASDQAVIDAARGVVLAMLGGWHA